jgi:lipopolysaccharide export system protein LptA
MKGFKLATAVVCFLTAMMAIAQEESRETFWIDAVNTIGRLDPSGSGVIKEFRDNVHAYQGDYVPERDAYEIDLRADRAEIITREAVARFYGNAVFKDTLRTLKARELTYYYRRKELFAEGQVEVTEEGRLFKSERVHYHKPNRILTATGDVYVYDDSLRSTVTGNEAVFNDSTNAGFITGAPVLTRVDSLGKILTITAEDTIRMYPEDEIIRLWNNVVVTQDSMQLVAKEAVYDDSLEVVHLTGDPKATHVGYEYDDSIEKYRRLESEVSGDSIRVYLDDRNISRVIIRGFAHNATVSTDSITGSLIDRTLINSENIYVDMQDQKVSMIAAIGTAESMYLTKSEEMERIYVNEARGDTLYFFFEDGKANMLRLTGLGGGGARGKYYEYAPTEDTLETWEVPEPIDETENDQTD